MIFYKDKDSSRIKVTSVVGDRYNGYYFDALCLYWEDELHKLQPYMTTRPMATALRRDFIALLRKYGWKQERKQR